MKDQLKKKKKKSISGQSVFAPLQRRVFLDKMLFQGLVQEDSFMNVFSLVLISSKYIEL